jgi:hypothetical protein
MKYSAKAVRHQILPYSRAAVAEKTTLLLQIDDCPNLKLKKD